MRVARFLQHALAPRRIAQMGVDVDQPRHHQERSAIDLGIDLALKTPTNLLDTIVGENEVRIAQIDVALGDAVPGNQPGHVSDAGGSHASLSDSG